MEPIDDPKLSKLLKEWQAPDAPPSLDARVLAHHRRWWSFLLTGSIRVPVPVGVVMVVVLVLMGLALVRRPAAAPSPSGFTLTDFQPVDNPSVRIIRGTYEPR